MVSPLKGIIPAIATETLITGNINIVKPVDVPDRVYFFSLYSHLYN